MSSTRPCIATPRRGPIASTTMAARASRLRFRNFTPSTSKSADPSAFIVYMTGTACGQPDGPTVARRPIRWERRKSSSAAVNTNHILDSTIHMAETTATAVGGYEVVRREPLERLGTYIELRHERAGARQIHIWRPDDNSGCAGLFPSAPTAYTGVRHI